MLAETPVTQRSPCYYAVSASLTIPLPDYSIIHHFAAPTASFLIQINTSLVSRARSFTKLLRWRLILHCCSALLQNLVRNSGVTQCLEEAEEQAEASGDVPPPPLQVVISVPFCLISILSLLPFTILPFLVSPGLSIIPSFSSDQFSVLLR